MISGMFHIMYVNENEFIELIANYKDSCNSISNFGNRKKKKNVSPYLTSSEEPSLQLVSFYK